MSQGYYDYANTVFAHDSRSKYPSSNLNMYFVTLDEANAILNQIQIYEYYLKLFNRNIENCVAKISIIICS